MFTAINNTPVFTTKRIKIKSGPVIWQRVVLNKVCFLFYSSKKVLNHFSFSTKHLTSICKYFKSNESIILEQ